MALVKFLSSRTRPELYKLLEDLNLTANEEEIFWLLSKGHSNVMICDEYGASPGTVARLIKNITDKIKRIEASGYYNAK